MLISKFFMVFLHIIPLFVQNVDALMKTLMTLLNGIGKEIVKLK